MRRPWPGLCVLIALAPALGEAAEIGLVPVFGPPLIIATRQAGTHVVRDVQVSLTAGANRFSFDFARVGADPATGRLALVAPDEGVQIVQQCQPAGEPSRTIWVLQAAQATVARLRLAYGVKGLETAISYRAMLQPAEQTLDLDCELTLRNTGPELFAQAQVVLPSGQRVTGDLRTGETVLQRLARFEKLPYQSYYLCDFSRFGTAVHAIVRLARDASADFDTQGLPAGPLKVNAPATDGLTALVTEVTLPYLAPHEPLELDLGAVPEVGVTRARVRAEQLNERTDVYRRVVLYDLEEQFDLSVANRRPGPISVKIQESIPGQWTMLKETHVSQRLDADTVEYALSLQPGETVALSYTVRRQNVEP